ncbi:hypothetical protein M9458_041312, partial [Cirrhinus mrigala]
PPWSGIDHPAPRDSTPPAAPLPSVSIRLRHPSGSTLVICHSGSTAAFWIHASTPAPLAPPRLYKSSSSPWPIGSPSPPRAPPPPAPPPLPFLLHGSSLSQLH